ncbi:hypothetical protein BDW68DRAFT_156525 [Aspergillus falconensis]
MTSLLIVTLMSFEFLFLCVGFVLAALHLRVLLDLNTRLGLTLTLMSRLYIAGIAYSTLFLCTVADALLRDNRDFS